MKSPIILEGFVARSDKYLEIKTIDSRLHAWLLESDAQMFIDTEGAMFYSRADVQKAEEQREYWDKKRLDEEAVRIAKDYHGKKD